MITVKPLEWKQVSDGRFASGFRPDHFTAENYTVHRVSRGWVIDDGRFTFLRKTFGSEIEAKTTAQAHWNQRILSALTNTSGEEIGSNSLQIKAFSGVIGRKEISLDYVADIARRAQISDDAAAIELADIVIEAIKAASDQNTSGDDEAPVAWMHPMAGWASESFDKIRAHCFNDGPAPIPLYARPQSAAVRDEASQAATDILAERRRQIETEGWTPEHDDQHTDGSMAQAAAVYALKARSDKSHAGGVRLLRPYLWPDSWNVSWWKPKDRRRDLVRAAALIIAEIERLDRAALHSTQEG